MSYKNKIFSRFQIRLSRLIFSQKLEDAYQLCGQCQRHLTKTLNRVKTKFIGSKLTQLGIKSLHALSQNFETATKQRRFFRSIVIIAIIILSVTNLFKDVTVKQAAFKPFLSDDHYSALLIIYNHTVAMRLTIIEMLENWLQQSGSVVSFMENFREFRSTDSFAISAMILNVLLLIGKSKLIRFQVLVSMLLWSIKMILAELELNPSHTGIMKGALAVLITIVSFNMFVKSQDEYNHQNEPINQSASFHRIHTELNEEDSDNELFDVTEPSFSHDTRSMRSSVYSPSLATSIRHRTFIQPTDKLLYCGNSTFTPKLDVRSVSSMGLPTVHNFSIAKEVSNADRMQVQKDINRLNIHDDMLGSTSTLKDFPTQFMPNPFSLDKSQCDSPAPSSVFSSCNRSQIVAPPRLEPAESLEKNRSWISGGYWAASPQKQFLEVNNFHPAFSRSSSQSSGFESRVNSEKNSRENSIHDDIGSMFSEPVPRRNIFADRPNRSLFLEKPAHHLSAFNDKKNDFFSSSYSKYRESNSFFK